MSVQGLTSHLTHNRSFADDFYRPDDQTNSVKALKEIIWSSRSDLFVCLPVSRIIQKFLSDLHENL